MVGSRSPGLASGHTLGATSATAAEAGGSGDADSPHAPADFRAERGVTRRGDCGVSGQTRCGLCGSPAPVRTAREQGQERTAAALF